MTADAVLLNGTVGAGKSTTAAALSELLSAAGTRHAVVDTDWIRMLRPPDADDPFQHRIAMQNLRDMARNFRAAGAERIVVAGVVETADERADLAASLAPWRLLTCRLTAPEAVLRDRLMRRHPDGAERDWHLRRAPALAAVLQRSGADDLVLDTATDPPPTIAARIARAAGWTRTAAPGSTGDGRSVSATPRA